VLQPESGDSTNDPDATESSITQSFSRNQNDRLRLNQTPWGKL